MSNLPKTNVPRVIERVSEILRVIELTRVSEISRVIDPTQIPRKCVRKSPEIMMMEVY